LKPQNKELDCYALELMNEFLNCVKHKFLLIEVKASVY
jgi:hypothetical protein